MCALSASHRVFIHSFVCAHLTRVCLNMIAVTRLFTAQETFIWKNISQYPSFFVFFLSYITAVTILFFFELILRSFLSIINFDLKTI